MARARQFQEALCLQEQSQTRTHRQPQRGIGLRRRQRPYSCAAVDMTVSRPYAIDAPRGLPFGSLAGRTWIMHSIESFLAGRANVSRARRVCDISLLYKTRCAAPDESETHRK